MSKLIKVKFEYSEIWMEAETDATSAEELVEGRPQKVSVSESMKKAVDSLDEVITTYCSSLFKTFKKFKKESVPNKITAEFGIKINGEGNIYVVKSSAEASITIIAEWDMK